MRKPVAEDDSWSDADTVRMIRAAEDIEAESQRDIAICVDPESIGKTRVESLTWDEWYESPVDKD